MSDMTRADALKLAAETVNQIGDRYSSGNDANFEQRVAATINLTYLILGHDNVVLESAPEEWFDDDTPEPAGPAPRRFRDKDGDEWRERADGTFDCYHNEEDGEFRISSVFLGYDINKLRNRWGPLTEITE